MENVFVVMGATGEHSDRNEWPVFAFKSKEAADAYVDKLVAWCREHNIHTTQGKHHGYYNFKEVCPLDDCLSVDYTGTNYYVMEVKVAA